MSKLPGESVEKVICFSYCPLKIGHRKLDVSKTITARSFYLEQLI